MAETVSTVIKKCKRCDQSKTSFNTPSPVLHPLPIKGLFYRFGFDLAGPFPATERGNQHAMIIIDHFSKWLVMVPLQSKDPLAISCAFVTHIISHFGAPAEVLTDQGGEFRAAFEEMLLEFQIQHRPTSANHPQADGLAERAVQTMKAALRRLPRSMAKDWDLELPLISLGYHISRHASLGYSPYHIVYGREPGIPLSIRDSMTDLDFDDPDRLRAALLHRVALLKRDMPFAVNNLKTAQLRDTLRYAEKRSGSWFPGYRFFHIGQFVYGKRRPANSTENTAANYILRIVNITADKMLVLQGRCGTTVRDNSVNWAPCKLTNVQSQLDRALVNERLDSDDRDRACEWCCSAQSDADTDNVQGGDHRGLMLICSNCACCWHKSCARVATVPEGDWHCPYCTRSVAELHKTGVVPVALLSQLHTSEDVHRAMSDEYPGPHSRAHVTRMFHRLPGQRSFLQPSSGIPECVITAEAEYESLCRAIDSLKSTLCLIPLQALVPQIVCCLSMECKLCSAISTRCITRPTWVTPSIPLICNRFPHFMEVSTWW
jgi:transposase InsO family protein